MGSDPYKIADVYVPWSSDDLDDFDETEWPGPDESAGIIARGKSREARNRVRQYLAMNGAAVWVRVERSLADANGSRETYPAASIVAAVTAAELTLRFLLLRPLIAGFVFNTRLAMRLMREGYLARTERDRALLPHVCREWGLDVEILMMPNGQPLWQSLVALIEVRNKYVHRAEAVLPEQASGALDCAQGLVDQVLRPLAQRLRLDWPPSSWTHKGRTFDPVEASYEFMGS